MNTPKRLLSGSDETCEYSTPTTRRRSRSQNETLTTPIDDQIEQVAKRHRVPSDTVKRIVSDLLTEPSVVDFLRSTLNQTSQTDNSAQRNLLLSPRQDNLITSSNVLVDEYDPLWLEFLQSLNSVENTQQVELNPSSQSIVNFDSLFNDDEDDEEFVGPEEETALDQTDVKKLRVSKRELALLLKESNATAEEITHKSNEENILAGDQYESLWSDFLASLQRENAESVDEPATSVATTTEDDDNEDDPEFRLPETELELDDDLDEELHVSRRELALLLQDNASILKSNDPSTSQCENPTSNDDVVQPSVVELQMSKEQLEILQFQLTAFVQLLTQYILLRRETEPASARCQTALNLFRELIFLRDKQDDSILSLPLLNEAQNLLENSPPTGRRKSFGNHLPFHLMESFCKNPSFVHESLLPTCLLSNDRSSSIVSQQKRNFVSGEDTLIGLGLEQKDAQIFLVGHDEKSIKDRINSLRYVRVRRGKQNPIRAFFTYGSVPDASLAPWYRPPPHFDYRFIYPDGLISKSNVVFPPWFRLSYKRSRQYVKNQGSTMRTPQRTDSGNNSQQNETPSSSTVYVVVEGSTPTTRTTSPKKVLQQIHMLHLLNSYPKLQPRQRTTN